MPLMTNEQYRLLAGLCALILLVGPLQAASMPKVGAVAKAGKSARPAKTATPVKGASNTADECDDDAGVAQQLALPSLAPVPAPLALAQAPDTRWDIRTVDRTLSGALKVWAARAGWQVLWEAPVDYAVEADTSIDGSFEFAVETVTKSMETAEIPLKAIFYNGNKILRVVGKGAH
jgi:hypothetical protein